MTIQKCKLDHLGGLGIFFSNHVVDSVIAGNELLGIADTGIALVGSTFYADGTQPTHPERNLVTMNHIHEVGVVGKGQAAYFQALASHNTVSRNVMYNGPRTGIEWCVLKLLSKPQSFSLVDSRNQLQHVYTLAPLILTGFCL